MSESTPEQKLWRSVITQAISDAFSRDYDNSWRAWCWFYNNFSEYRWVCSMAGIPSEKLRKNILEKVFFMHLFQKGELKMNKTNESEKEVSQSTSQKKQIRSIAREFQLVSEAKALFRAIYSQQELDKQIGRLTLQDIFNMIIPTKSSILRGPPICRQSRSEYKKLSTLED
ncbi:MAG: hypothetical protein LBT04_04745 [Prevotellaceae bacterium]|jgi:hypothetical protein|nr:hypothetical protein [Prevotellaceae bacterium]